MPPRALRHVPTVRAGRVLRAPGRPLSFPCCHGSQTVLKVTSSAAAIKPVRAVENSENAKTGLVSATYASQESCPADCPFRGAGCYAEGSRVGFHTRRLNRSPVTDPAVIARAEA